MVASSGDSNNWSSVLTPCKYVQIKDQMQFREATNLHPCRVGEKLQTQAKEKWKRAPRFAPGRWAPGRKCQKQQYLGWSWRNEEPGIIPRRRALLLRGSPSLTLYALNTGGCFLQIQRAAGRQGRGRLTEESAISLRVWSDPTAKMILPSGEMVTQL